MELGTWSDVGALDAAAGAMRTWRYWGGWVVYVDDGVYRYRGYRVGFFVVFVSFVAIFYYVHSFLPQ